MKEVNGEDTLDLAQFSEIRQSGSFEESLAALEIVVAHLEHGLLAINEAISWYELGLTLAQRCTSLLQQAELRIVELEESFGLSPDAGPPWLDN